MDPVGRNVAKGPGLDLYCADLAFWRLEQHEPMSAFAIVHFRPIGVGVDMAAGEEIFASDLARPHPGDANDHVAGVRRRLEVGDFVDDLAASLAMYRPTGARGLREAIETGEGFDVAFGPPGEFAPSHVDAADSGLHQ